MNPSARPSRSLQRQAPRRAGTQTAPTPADSGPGLGHHNVCCQLSLTAEPPIIRLQQQGKSSLTAAGYPPLCIPPTGGRGAGPSYITQHYAKCPARKKRGSVPATTHNVELCKMALKASPQTPAGGFHCAAKSAALNLDPRPPRQSAKGRSSCAKGAHLPFRPLAAGLPSAPKGLPYKSVSVPSLKRVVLACTSEFSTVLGQSRPSPSGAPLRSAALTVLRSMLIEKCNQAQQGAKK